LKVTTPFEVSTLILAALVVTSAASLFFTAVLTVASLAERLSQPVREMTSAATIAINESFIFYTPLYCSLTQRLALIHSNHQHPHGFRRNGQPSAMWMQCEIFRAITMPGSERLRIADCGLRIEEDFNLYFTSAVEQSHNSAIRNPQSALWPPACLRVKTH